MLEDYPRKDPRDQIAPKRRRRRGSTSATINDVAARAGVGAITVSRVIRQPHLVSEKLRKNIEAAIRELNYVPNINAQSLARVRSGILGLVIPTLSQTVFTDVMRGVYDGVEGMELQVQIANTRYSPVEEERLIKLFVRQLPTGMIVAGTEQTGRSREMLKQAGCPIIQIMDLTDDPIDRVIGFDHVAAGQRMTEHLVEQGYRNIAFLTGWIDSRGGNRYIGYKQALAAAGMTPPFELPLWHLPRVHTATASLGRDLFRRALEIAPDIDAVFCNNDILALGALFECNARGLDVPNEMGIAGFNDHEYAAAANPGLTSVRTQRYRIGYDAVVMLREELDGKNPPQVLDIGTNVVARQSTNRRGALSSSLNVADAPNPCLAGRPGT